MYTSESTKLPYFVVSVQAEDHEPLASFPVLTAMCESVLQGGAESLRLANLEAMQFVKKRYPACKVIGLHKPYPLPEAPKATVYITATLECAKAIAATGVEIVALDATARPRPQQETLPFIISNLKVEFPGVLVMGDIDSPISATYALNSGCDMLSTTLAGYTLETAETSPKHSPDFELLQALVKAYPTVPVYCEGRIWSPDEAKQAIALGATGVVVGSAITRPHHITARFKATLG